MELSTIGLSLVTLLLASLYWYVKQMYTYWERMGIPAIKPTFPYGNLVTLGKTQSHGPLMQMIYKTFRGTAPFCGVYMFNSPMALALDPNFLKTILIKDFAYFHDRGFYYNEKHDPLSATLFRTEGEKWKKSRAKFTHTFTSSKMKFMYPTTFKVADQFKNTLSNDILQDTSKDLDIKELLARFTIDVIGLCAFGIECNSLINPNSEFGVIGRKVFTEPRHYPIMMFIASMNKTIARYLGFKTTTEEVEKFFVGIVNDTINFRKKNNITRNDFMDLLIEIKKENELNTNKTDEITMNELAAQAFAFFVAGFESTACTITMALYELAFNKEVQTKTRDEIMRVVQKHDNKLTFESISYMPYVDQVINETLRKYPSGSILFREVSKDYHVPGTKYVLPKGLALWVPVLGFHMDPEIYPEPDRFDPDRFSPEEINKRDNITYMPFGHGPRYCIGDRFAIMVVRVGLVMLLSNYEFSVCSQTLNPLSFSKKTIIYAPDCSVYLNVKKVS